MRALLVVDVQNEFSPGGLRALPGHGAALAAIIRWVAYARAAGWPIAWVRHHNKPHESRAFVPGSWGAELSPGLGPRPDSSSERLFEKDVFGAFTGTGLEEWLRARHVTDVVAVGFYAHMCLSTTVREALVRGFEVSVDPDATGACHLEHPLLGRQTADEVRRSTLLQLAHMGATIAAGPAAASRESTAFATPAPATA
jgi:nicotinamidase-related amidase